MQLCREIPGEALYNMGDGWLSNRLGSGSVLVTPPDTEVAYDVRCPHKLLF